MVLFVFIKLNAIQMNKIKSELVVKSNDLIEASYYLDLMEQRILIMAIVDARESKKVLNEGFITIEAKRFSQLFGINEKVVYSQLKEAMNTLFNRSVIIKDIHAESGKQRVNKTRWVSTASYIDGVGAIQLRFATDIIPFITRLGECGNFTAYKLEQIGGMTSIYAIRLYEILIQYLTIGKRNIDLMWLRETLQITPDEYPRLFDLKKRIIDVAVNQINLHSDINTTYTQLKKGKIVTNLIFEITQKEKKATKTKVKVDDDFINKNALPGESWSAAQKRLSKNN